MSAKSEQNRKNGEQGLALVVVLWILTALTLLIASFSSVVKTNIMVAGADQRLSIFMSNIDSGLELAAFNLLDPKTSIDWSAPDRIHAETFNNQDLQFRIDDPNGLVDLNTSDKSLVLNLLLQFTRTREEAEDILNEILEKREKSQPKGAEAQKQKALRAISRVARQKVIYTFKDVSELRQVSGVSHELYEQLKPFVTVYNSSGAINPATAPLQVLKSVPKLNKPTIDELLKRRAKDHTDKKIYSDIVSRNAKLLKVGKRDLYIITVASPWNNSDRYIGRRYVIATGLNNDKPYYLLSWREHRQ